MIDVLLDSMKSLFVLVQVARLTARYSPEKSRDIILLIGVIDTREENDPVEVFVHVRRRVLNKHLHLVD